MITIIADPYAYQKPQEDAVHVTHMREYVPTRIKIRQALDSNEPMHIHVTDRLVAHWLKDLAEYDGVHFDAVDPQADYRRMFGSDPLPPFTAELLIALDIASLDAPLSDDTDPAQWILSKRLHPVWGVPQASSAHLIALLTWIITSTEPIQSRYIPLIQHALARWAETEPAYACLHAGSLIADAYNLLRRAALQHYAPNWLHEQGLAQLPAINAQFAPELWVSALQAIEPDIGQYWRERIAHQATVIDRAFIHANIAHMSGWSISELRVVEQLMSQHAQLLDPGLIRVIRQRFNNLPDAGATLDALDMLVPPPTPSLPTNDWDDTQWLRWATDTYLPYLGWLIRAKQPREAQEHYTLAYEQWLVQRYPKWLTSIETPLITKQFTLLRDIVAKQPEAVVIWLIVDGMTWWQAPILRDYCKHQGLYLQRYEAGIAMLPSLTNISKRALVTGVPTGDVSQHTIAEAAQVQFARAGIRGIASYDQADLQDALHGKTVPQCLVWFANTLDTLAHERTAFAADSMVRGYLKDLAVGLAQFHALATARGRAFHVLIGSDHGSTLLPEHAPTRRIPQATREVVDVWDTGQSLSSNTPASARAVQVSDPERLQIDPKEWYHLNRLDYELPHDYLVPCGYAAVKRRPTGWTHGGLSPEETIVALMHLTPEPLELQPLHISISGRIQPRKESTLTIQIVNTNPAPFEQVVVQIDTLAPLQIDYLKVSSHSTYTLLFPARSVEGTEVKLIWSITGSALGVEYRQQGEARIIVRRLQTEDSFGDLFV
jgi:hypothetical protein